MAAGEQACGRQLCRLLSTCQPPWLLVPLTHHALLHPPYPISFSAGRHCGSGYGRLAARPGSACLQAGRVCVDRAGPKQRIPASLPACPAAAVTIHACHPPTSSTPPAALQGYTPIAQTLFPTADLRERAGYGECMLGGTFVSI